MVRFIAVAFVVLFLVACAKGTPENPIFPAGASVTPLQQPAYVGIGRYYKLAETTAAQSFGGVSFVSIIEVQQNPDATVIQGDASGFLYALKGPHNVYWDDGEHKQAWAEGGAGWVNPGVSHVNLTQSMTTWYLVTFRPVAQRASTPLLSGGRTLYASPDLPAAPPGKQLVHQLGIIAMDPGGRTSAHSHSGAEVFYVMQGTVELAVNNGTRTKLTAGQGAAIRPGLVMQLNVVGGDAVQILTYFATPEGEPWQTNLQTLP